MLRRRRRTEYSLVLGTYTTKVSSVSVQCTSCTLCCWLFGWPWLSWLGWLMRRKSSKKFLIKKNDSREKAAVP